MQGSVLVVSAKWQIDRRSSGVLSILVKAAEKGACNCGYYNGTTTDTNTETNINKKTKRKRVCLFFSTLVHVTILIAALSANIINIISVYH